MNSKKSITKMLIIAIIVIITLVPQINLQNVQAVTTSYKGSYISCAVTDEDNGCKTVKGAIKFKLDSKYASFIDGDSETTFLGLKGYITSGLVDFERYKKVPGYVSSDPEHYMKLFKSGIYTYYVNITPYELGTVDKKFYNVAKKANQFVADFKSYMYLTCTDGKAKPPVPKPTPKPTPVPVRPGTKSYKGTFMSFGVSGDVDTDCKTIPNSLKFKVDAKYANFISSDCSKEYVDIQGYITGGIITFSRYKKVPDFIKEDTKRYIILYANGGYTYVAMLSPFDMTQVGSKDRAVATKANQFIADFKSYMYKTCFPN